MTNISEEDEAQIRYVNLLIESGQKPKGTSEIFGKTYIWLVDPATDRWYLERLPNA